MESASPFHNLAPHKYVKLRYSPLIATFVEPDVENLFNQCNISFNDLFSVLGSTQNMPLRIVPHYTIMEESQDTFFSKVFNDCTLFSQSFIMPEYETKDITVPQLSPTPDRFPSQFHYPSPEASKPIWYVLMLENLLKSCQYTNLNFTDLPSCIIYATLGSSSLPIKKADEIKKILQFPAWMKEFIGDIPVVRIVIYDGLVQKKIDMHPSSGSFDKAFSLVIKSRNADAKSDFEDFYLSNLFKFDEKLLRIPDFCKFLTKSDFENIREVLTSIYGFISNHIETSIKTLELIYKQSKSFFGKSKVERLVQGIPWARVLLLQIASNYLLLQKTEESRKYYKLYIKEMQQNNELRLYAQFMAALCIVNSSDPQEFKTSIIEIMRDINYARSLRFLMMVPLLSVEFHSSVNEKEDAYLLMKQSIAKVVLFWNGNVPMKSLFLALFSERMAGLSSDPKKSLFLTSRAAYYYKTAGQIPHAIRCYIWLQRGLSNQSWVLLFQTAWYQKASLLCKLTQYQRGLNDWKALLGLPNLSESLQDRVVNKFWEPFKENQKSLSDKLDTNAKISLLNVRSLEIIDLTVPEYWKLDKNEFEPINETFEKFVSKKIARSVSFDSWYEDDLTSKKKKKKIHKVGVGDVIILKLKLYNKFKFSIKLEKCTLKADFHLLSKGGASNFGSSEVLALSKVSPLYSSTENHSPLSGLVPKEGNLQESNLAPKEDAEKSDSLNGGVAGENINKNDSVAAKDQEEEDEVFVSENEKLGCKNLLMESEAAPVSYANCDARPSNPIVAIDDGLDDDDDYLLDNDDDNIDELFGSSETVQHNQNPNQALSPEDKEKEEEMRKQKKMMDAFSEKFYKIDQINETVIPGLSKKATEISFKFVPLAEGRYTVSRFEKNYWGIFDTEVPCGPITFIAKNTHPQLSMQLIDFPENCYSGQCAQFSIKLTNIGNATIKEICILHDQNDSLFFLDCYPTKYPDVSINVLQTRQRIEPKETFVIKMILWAKMPEKKPKDGLVQVPFHFCVAANGLKCGYEKKVVTISESAIFDFVNVKKDNDTLNNVFQTTITSLIDGLTVVGFINKNCHFLKTIATDLAKQTLNKGESASIIGLTLDDTNELSESWRSELCDKNSIAVLYKIKDDKINAQTNLYVKLKEPKYRLKIHIDEVVQLHNRCRCLVRIFKHQDDGKSPNKIIYIRPFKFRFIDMLNESDIALKKPLPAFQLRMPSVRSQQNLASNRDSVGKPSLRNSGKITQAWQQKPPRSPPLGSIAKSSSAAFTDQLKLVDQISGCQWIGTTTQRINDDVDVDAYFDFIPMKIGVYELPGFLLSFTSDFKNPIQVKVSTIFRVEEKL